MFLLRSRAANPRTRFSAGGTASPLTGFGPGGIRFYVKTKSYILGAMAGDIIGSAYEFHNVKSTDFELFTLNSSFTDDTVLTAASMYAILNHEDYAQGYHRFGRIYPHAGCGGHFRTWLSSDAPAPAYYSYGNGSAMRVSPVGWYCGSINAVLEEAKKSAEVTHNHPEGMKGAQAAAAVYLVRTGTGKGDIKKFVVEHFGYNLDRTLDEIRPGYTFNESCQGSVPEAIIAFLESSDYESAVRLAVSLGGDSDTIAAIAGCDHTLFGEIPVRREYKCCQLNQRTESCASSSSRSLRLISRKVSLVRPEPLVRPEHLSIASRGSKRGPSPHPRPRALASSAVIYLPGDVGAASSGDGGAAAGMLISIRAFTPVGTERGRSTKIRRSTGISTVCSMVMD
jgi:ADP-ribosylglycohydrolase